MAETGGGSAEQSFYDAVARWNVDTGRGLVEMIHAACQALIGGLDSPSLRELAGASVKDSSWDIRELVSRSLEELGIPYPGAVPPGFAVSAGGGVTRRSAVDSLRLAILEAPGDAGGGFQVQVYVNEVEMTSAGAGLGMDPYDVLVPTNRLVAASRPRTVPIARCDCGVYGCGSTDVTITRDGDRVHWNWSIEVPMSRGACFAAADYDAEVARVAADHSWETGADSRTARPNEYGPRTAARPTASHPVGSQATTAIPNCSGSRCRSMTTTRSSSTLRGVVANPRSWRARCARS